MKSEPSPLPSCRPSSVDLGFDRNHLWHPYSNPTHPLPTYPVETARKQSIFLDDGTELVDGMSSWWAAVHGYNHPRLNSAARTQLDKVAHIMFGGLSHTPAIELARALLTLLPQTFDKVFFCDSGSVAIEVAMKMALQYQIAIGKPQKYQFATIRGGYHGDTWNAMSVCDPETGMHHLFSRQLPIHHFAAAPQCAFDESWNERDFRPMEDLLIKHHQTIAAVVVEPIVQGAGRMYFYHRSYLVQLKSLCEKLNVLLIFDEIATGFYRTGKAFAMNHANVTPDIVCVGKALTGGYLSLAATVTTEKVAQGIGNAAPGVFMHGPTFMGNPLACAIARESIQLLTDENAEQNVLRIEHHFTHAFKALQHPRIVNTRTLGGISVIECADTIDLAKATPYFVSQKVWLRPFGKLLYCMPPYSVTEPELRLLSNAMISCLDEDIFTTP